MYIHFLLFPNSFDHHSNSPGIAFPKNILFAQFDRIVSAYFIFGAFASNCVKADLVTIAHQDDLYEPTFLEETLKFIKDESDFIICFTDYNELKLGKIEKSNLLLRIKRFMNWPLSKKCMQKNKFIRRRSLSIGCAICCPTVTFNKKKAGLSVFDTVYINSCDYKTWCDLAELDGKFIYINKPLLTHRIYSESATSKNLGNNIRQKEDLEIFSRYWPKPIAKFINKVYALSEKSNKI